MFGPGTLTGATDFILRQPRTFRVAAQEGRVRAVSMHRSDFEALADKDPEVSVCTGCYDQGMPPWHALHDSLVAQAEPAEPLFVRGLSLSAFLLW